MKTATDSKQGPGGITPVIWLGLFAALVALLGGSARFDAVQIAALRPLAALFLIPALYFLTRDGLRDARIPLLLLAAITVWTALQLVPLPPAIWHALPGRGILAELDTLQGISDTWRPIAWVPMRGWNALAALVVPIAAALLLVAFRPRVRPVLMIIAGLGIVDAALGLLQILSGPSGPLYFYTHTNAGSPVGLFANENHSAVFSAMVLVIIARLALVPRRRAVDPVITIALSGAFLLVLIGLLVSGSRAGLGLGLVALIASGAMAWLKLAEPRLDSSASGPIAAIMRRPRIVLAVATGAIIAMLYALFQFERAPGVIDAMNQNAFEDLRWSLLPILQEMIATHWLLGSGFGSFDAVYMIVEPGSFLSSSYLNQAHNDWAQIVIEGGAPAAAILIALIVWLYSAIRSMFARNPAGLSRCLFWATLVATIAAASLFDYPLRTPIFQVIGVWLAVLLSFEMKEIADPRKKEMK